MTPQNICDLVESAKAGARLRDTFNFDRHRFVRYLMRMETLQTRLGCDGSLASDRDRYDSFRPLLAAGILRGRGVSGAARQELVLAPGQATRELLDAVVGWRDPPSSAARSSIDFLLTDERVPAWAMRVAPKV